MASEMLTFFHAATSSLTRVDVVASDSSVRVSTDEICRGSDQYRIEASEEKLRLTSITKSRGFVCGSR